MRTFPRQESSVRSVGFSWDGQLLAVASDDTYIDIVRVWRGKEQRERGILVKKREKEGERETSEGRAMYIKRKEMKDKK